MSVLSHNSICKIGALLCGLCVGAGVILAGGHPVKADDTGAGNEASPMPEISVTPEVSATPEPSSTAVVPIYSDIPTAVPTSTPTASPAVSATVKPTDNPSSDADKKIKLNHKSVRLGIGEIVKLTLGSSVSDVKWSSSDSSVVTVSKKGKIRGIKSGKASVKAVYKGKNYKCNVTVGTKGIEFVSYEMKKGEILRIHLDDKNEVKWTSSNKKIATVKAGKVTALKEGNVTIKAVTDEKTYSCNITVDNKTKGVIYLTFDDGPTSSSTPKILKILKKNNVKATFFTIGIDSVKEKYMKQEDKEGHTVAIHGASHDYNKIYASDQAYMNNIITQQKNIEKAIGKKSWITRFPGGSSNLVSRHYNRGIMSRLVKSVDKAGFAYFDWNVSSGDAGGAYTSSQVYNNVTRGLSKSRDNVVLMHDFANNNKTIGALDGIIKYGKSHGYIFKAITSSTNEVHHGVQN